MVGSRGVRVAGGRVGGVAGALAAVLIAAGCAPGSILPGGGHQKQSLAYAACMRSHGVADFPDPKNGGFIKTGNRSTTTVNGVTLKESQAQISGADQACASYRDSGGGGPASPAQQQAALAYAQCMRSHGIADFPDPHVTAHSFTVHIPPGLDTGTPQFQAAKAACQSLLPGPGGRKGSPG